MNVGIFTDNDFAKVNGVTTTLRAVLKYAPEGVRPRIYTCADVEENQDNYCAAASPGVRIPFYPDMRIYFPRVLTLLNRVRIDKIDVLHLTTPGPVGLATLFVAWRTGLSMVGSFHTDLAAYAERLSGFPQLGVVMQEFLRWPYGRCARILVPSDATRQLLVRSRIDGSRIGLWTRGVDTQLFCPSKRSPLIRERWKVNDRRPAIAYVGRISKEKGLDRLPEIQSILHCHAIDHRLILIGDGPYRRELQERLPDAVFTGTLSPPAVAVALASADVFLFPSDTETAGNVVLEAQACGLPVIVSDAGGPKEYVRAGATGIVCAAGDIRAFCAATVNLLHNVPRRREMGIAARAHAETLRWETALEPLYRAYREVAAASLIGSASRPTAEHPGGAAA
jgi:glycosyltransferase involved in cell wall biosynthesis